MQLLFHLPSTWQSEEAAAGPSGEWGLSAGLLVCCSRIGRSSGALDMNAKMPTGNVDGMATAVEGSDGGSGAGGSGCSTDGPALSGSSSTRGIQPSVDK